jgi:hypothetical protein
MCACAACSVTPCLAACPLLAACRRLECPAATCSVPMRGQLQSGLQRLPHLETLSLRQNELTGPLPSAWGEPGSFTELLEM